MAGVLQHLRSSTLNKRPNPASMVDGQVAINYASGSPGMFFKDSSGALVKVGPVHVGSTAPNVSPASGGTAGNSLGEQWLDTSGGTYIFKIWDGGAWRSEAGEFVNSTGDTMTGSLTMGPSADLIFEGSVDDGFETTLTVVNPTADRTITLPNVTGTVITTGDSGTVTSTMIADGAIVNGDVNASAAIAGTKISPDFGSQNATTTGTSTAASFIPSSSTVPANGVYLPAANTVGVATSGAERLRVTSTGVGIGTTSPRFLVSLGSTSATSSSAPDTIDLGGTFSSTAGANPKLRLYWDGSQSYGFGVSSGQLDYMVAGAAAHVWHINNSERARIDSSGRLLIGTSSARSNFFNTGSIAPSLQVEGTTYSTSSLSLIANGSGATVNPYPFLVLGRTRGGSVGSTTVVNSGDVLGGVSFQGSDGTEFVEAGSILCEVDGTPGANDMPGRLVFSTTADGASSTTERMRIRNNGRTDFVGTATDYTLVSSTSQSAGTTTEVLTGVYGSTGVGTGTVSFRVYSNGNVQNTNNSYGAISDIKLKENIADANSQWSDIKALQVRKYNFKEGQTHTQIGLVAQEVELVSPGLVTESPDRDAEGNDLGTVTKSVNYSVLYVKAVKALQEAMERIEVLEARLDAANR